MIKATLTAADAARESWQCIVIGAGPGGAAAAIRLARQGLRVLLLEREQMPRAKVCGCCLSPTALAELDALDACSNDGLAIGPNDPAAITPVPLAAVRIVARGRVARIAMSRGATLSREALDAALVRRAIEAGAEWLPGVTATAIDDDASGIWVAARAGDAAESTNNPVRFRGDHAIVAAGLADHVRTPEQRRFVAASSRVGIGAILPADAVDLPISELVMAVGRAGYAGLVRLEDGRIDLAAAVDRRALAAAKRPADAAGRLLEEALGGCGMNVSPGPLRAATFRATPALTRQAPLVAGAYGRIFRVGDAAGYVEPFTGEGMGWALASARILAASFAGAEAHGSAEPNRSIADRYRQEHARLFTWHHARCRGIAEAVRHPVLVAGAVRLAQAAPRIAAGVVPWLVGGVAS